jgi:hypothetical protein
MNLCRKIVRHECAAKTVIDEEACDYYKKGVLVGCDLRALDGTCNNYNAIIGERYLISSDTFRVTPYIKSKYDLGTFILKVAKEKKAELDKEYPSNIHLLERVESL